MSRKDIVMKFGAEIQDDSMKRMDSTLSRVKMISVNSPEYKPLFLKLSTQFDEIDVESKAIMQIVANLTATFTKIKRKEFSEHVSRIKNALEIFSRLVTIFENDAKGVIQQDDFMRSELAFLQKHLRSIIDVYKSKRVFLRDISSKVDALIFGIKETEANFDIALNSGNNADMAEQLAILSKEIIMLARVVNEGPTIQTFLSATIPKRTMKLLKMYKRKKTELNTTFENVDLVSSFNQIKSKFASANDSFKNIQIDKAEKMIIEIFKSLKVLERMVNIEIESRNIFESRFSSVNEIIRSTLESYEGIVDNVKRNIRSKISNELIELIAELNEYVEVLKSNWNVFKKLGAKQGISHSSKMSRMKIILGECVVVTTKMNDVETLIWGLSSRKAILQNKFSRTVAALNSLIAKKKNNRIIFSAKQEDLLKEIKIEISSITSLVNSPVITSDDELKIEKTLRRISDFYLVASGKIQMAKLANHLIKKLSSQRSSNTNLNFAVISAEKEYLSGRYDSSLNAIIAWMESGE